MFLWRRVVVFLLGGAWSLPLVAADPPHLPFSLVASTGAFAQARVRDFPEIVRTDTSLAEATANGGEQNPCNFPELNVSHARAFAKVDKLVEAPDRLSYKILSTASAFGGHMVSCALGCVLGQCTVIIPNNTPAQSFARGNVAVDILFSPDSNLLPYNLAIQSSSAATSGPPSDLRIRLVDATGATLIDGALLSQTLKVPGGPGRNYRLAFESIAWAAHDNRHESGSQTDISVSLSLAPLMENSDNPIIGGGEKTDLYPEVGALLLNGGGNCTGTLIGKKTVLTAAHCVFGHDQPGEMTFAQGPNYKNAGSKRSVVTATFYPRADRDGLQDGLPLQFAFADLQNDIAIAQLADEFDKYLLLPDDPRANQAPPLSSLKDTKANLMFVGYGNRVVNGQPLDAGPKRRVPMPISGLEDTKFLYYTGGPSTCNGDSGGPALEQWGDSFIVVGIASGGDCKGSGSHMRVDHYLSWIHKFLKTDPAFAPSAQPAAPAGSM